MATTKIVLLSESTGGWFFDPSQPQEFMPRELYERYGRTVRTASNPNVGGSYSALVTRWYGGVGADEIELWDASIGGSNQTDITAAELQVRVTDVAPQFVFIAYGINDFTTQAQLETELTTLVDDVQAAVPTTTVVMISQNPIKTDSGSPAKRDAVQAVASAKGLLFIDVYQAFIDYGDWENDLLSDDVHPNAAGKQLYADTADADLFDVGSLGAPQEASTVAVINSAEVVLRANRYSGSGDWLDESGNGHDAVPTGSPPWDGEKFTLDGATQYFTISDHANFNPGTTGHLTVVVVLTVASDVAALGRIIEKRLFGGSAQSVFDIYYDHGTNDRYVGFTSDGTNTAQANTAIGSVTQGTRQALAFRLNRTDDTWTAILDGTPVAPIDAAAIGDLTNTRPVTIGRTGQTDGSYLKGDIYGVAIFTTSLSDADVVKAGQELIEPVVTYTAYDPRLQTDAILARLNAQLTRPVGDAVAPDDATRPYTVVYPLDDDLGELSQVDPHMVANPVFQVTSVGDNRKQAQWMQKQVRDVLLGWTPTVVGYSADPVEGLLSGRVLRDPDVQPPLFSAVDRFTFRIQATS